MPKGYSSPRSPEGRSSLVGAPPWHYVGTMLVVEYWADPAAAAAVLPAPLEPHPDGGRAAAMFIDWQSCGDDGGELVDPSRSQYKEFFITVNALYEGEEVAYCPYIWVDRDFALARGWIQGFPKKLGSVWVTRSFGLDTRADPGEKPGARYGGTCAAYERRLAEATITLERESDDRAHPQRPADRQRSPLPAPREGPPRRPGRARARALEGIRPQRLGDLGGLGDARAVRRSRRGADRACAGADRQGLSAHDRLLGRRPRNADRAVSIASSHANVADVAGIAVSTDHFIGGERVASARALHRHQPDRRPRARRGLRRRAPTRPRRQSTPPPRRSSHGRRSARRAACPYLLRLADLIDANVDRIAAVECEDMAMLLESLRARVIGSRCAQLPRLRRARRRLRRARLELQRDREPRRAHARRARRS